MPETEQKVTLYDLSATLMEALRAIAEAEAEAEANGEQLSTEEQESFLRVIESEMRGKTDRMCQFIHHLESQVQLSEAEIKRLGERKKGFESSIQRLENYAHRVLTEVLHTEKLDGETTSIRLRKLPDTVSILNRDFVPAEYRQEIPADFKLNLNALKAALKAGKAIGGALLNTNRTKAEFK